MDKIKCLQIGDWDYRTRYELPEYVEYTHAREMTSALREKYQVVLLDRALYPRECGILQRVSSCYGVFLKGGVPYSGLFAQTFQMKKGMILPEADLPVFLQSELRFFFDRGYGGKLDADTLSIAREFTGKKILEGHSKTILSGDFGSNYYQIAGWRENIYVPAGDMIDLWLEYSAEDGAELALIVTSYRADGEMDISNARYEFDDAGMQNLIRIESRENSSFYFSLFARGEGTLEIGALHYRRSRGSHGYFLPGGKRYVTSDRQEIFAYFEPGNRKPPFTVYFGGYNEGEGFEGLQMMRQLGTPFLILSDVRLEGGAFFIGSQEYEEMLLSIIRSCQEELHMGSRELVLSGMSMGAYGALYYGTTLTPHAIIIGKPLTNLGDVAYLEKHVRPFGFGTSLDVLQYLEGATYERARQHLNGRLWNRFDKADFGNTKFVVAYMLEDDYDPSAYNDLLSHVKSEGAEVYGKGIHGRHNEHTDEIVKWFSKQFAQIVQEDFGQ